MLHRRSWQVMGTWASLVTAGAEEADLAQQLTAEVLAAADQRFSSYRSDSELTRFNLGHAEQPSAQLREVLAACAWLERESGGVFSAKHPGSPNSHDVAGYVKGWAVDRAADRLDSAGIAHYALGVGGDWRLRGGHPEGRPWRWGIVDPLRTDRPRAMLSLSDGAVATSGTYERGAHLHTAGTGQRLSSFTVVGPELRWADAFATTGFLMGTAGMQWVSRYTGYSSALVDHAGTMLADQSFPLSPGSDYPEWSAPYSRGAAFEMA